MREMEKNKLTASTTSGVWIGKSKVCRRRRLVAGFARCHLERESGCPLLLSLGDNLVQRCTHRIAHDRVRMLFEAL